MTDHIIHIYMLRDTGNQTLCKLVLTVRGSVKFECLALMPSWLGNLPFVSRIPEGTYPVEKWTSPSHGPCLHVMNVPGRSHILIHVLNFFHQTEGCIGVGDRFTYINDDLQYDLRNSKPTLEKLMALLPQESTLVLSKAEGFQTMYVEAK